MTVPLLVAMPGNEAMAQMLARPLLGDIGGIEVRSFPDGETYLRFFSDLSERMIVIACTLDRPNEKILPLLFAAATARELGAEKVGLVAPYLAYMRQDRRFKPGEAVTSRQIAQLLSNAFDWLVTVDPPTAMARSPRSTAFPPARSRRAADFAMDQDACAEAVRHRHASESEQWYRRSRKIPARPMRFWKRFAAAIAMSRSLPRACPTSMDGRRCWSTTSFQAGER